MNFDLDQRTARLGVGEFSDFTVGPRGGGGGASGLWRAQLGTRWHRELRAQTSAAHPQAEFESAIEGAVVHRGWSLTFNGRIDQLVREGERLTLREIKTVTRSLPENESVLRSDYPGYFIQLATYAALTGLNANDRIHLSLVTRHSTNTSSALRAELVFVESDSGLAQTVPLGPADEALFRAQLDRVAEFLDLRLRGRNRLRDLSFSPPFGVLRPGQGAVGAQLESAITGRHSAILLEAPTGFGKTGVLLEFALNQLRCGNFDRAVYVTGKSTGQLHVVQTLATMMSPASEPHGEAGGGREEVGGSDASGSTSSDLQPPASNLQPRPSNGLAVWQVRSKAEHCVNHTFHCVRAGCAYLDGMEARWRESGLARFYLFDGQARDLETLRGAGRAAGICPYEITRAALAFNDVWIGDYNYVFSPSNRGLFYEQPGFDPGRTLLIIDEAHNLASRVADALSHSFAATDAFAARQAFDQARPAAPFILAWDEWAYFLHRLEPTARLDASAEEEARSHLIRLAGAIPALSLDSAALGPRVMELLWEIPAFAGREDGPRLPSLWWCPRAGELAITCLDAADAIGATLGEFGGVALATATPGPVGAFADAIGLRRKPESAAGAALFHVKAATPWREGAYDVACDLRVDTSFSQRRLHHATTAAAVEALSRTASGVAVFFPSYAYAEAIVRELAGSSPDFRASLQPRLAGLAAQAAWIEDSLASADALFLVLGSSFAESIDLLGGRVTRALVAGPALPEVNAVQKARLDALAAEGRETAFRRVYQIPGMQKVNQALGRLVRAPGQRAKVLLHCRRFAEPAYAELLAPDLGATRSLSSEADLNDWLADGNVSTA